VQGFPGNRNTVALQKSTKKPHEYIPSDGLSKSWRALPPWPVWVHLHPVPWESAEDVPSRALAPAAHAHPKPLL
jgi:hypothetical protein